MGTWWQWILGVLLGVFLLGNITGCETPEDKFLRILNSPTVQNTLDKWEIQGGFDDPELRGEIGTFVSFTMNRVKSEYEAEGDSRGGVDFEGQKAFTELAAEYGLLVPPGLSDREFFMWLIETFKAAPVDVSTNG